MKRGKFIFADAAQSKRFARELWIEGDREVDRHDFSRVRRRQVAVRRGCESRSANGRRCVPSLACYYFDEHVAEGDDSKTRGEPAHQTDPQASGEAGLRAGDRIGRYVLISIASAQGGMGVVYAAYDPGARSQGRAQAAARRRHQHADGTARACCARRRRWRGSRTPTSSPSTTSARFDEHGLRRHGVRRGQTLRAGCETPRAAGARSLDVFVRAPGAGSRPRTRPAWCTATSSRTTCSSARDGRVRVVDFGLARDGRGSVEPAGGRRPIAPTAGRSASPAHDDDRLARRASVALAGDARRSDHRHARVHGARAGRRRRRRRARRSVQLLRHALRGALSRAPLRRHRHHRRRRAPHHRREAELAPRSAAVEPPRHTDVPSWVQRIVMRALVARSDRIAFRRWTRCSPRSTKIRR